MQPSLQHFLQLPFVQQIRDRMLIHSLIVLQQTTQQVRTRTPQTRQIALVFSTSVTESCRSKRPTNSVLGQQWPQVSSKEQAHKNPADPTTAQTPIHQPSTPGSGLYHFSCVSSVNPRLATTKHTEATICGIQYAAFVCHCDRLDRIPGRMTTPHIPYTVAPKS